MREISLKTMISAVCVVAGAWLLLQLLPVVLVIVVALFVAGTLSPAIEWLEAHRVKRVWGIALVFSTVLLTTVLVPALTIPPLVAQVTTIAKQAPTIRDFVAGALARWHLSAPLAESIRNLRYEAVAQAAASMAFAYSTRIVAIIAYLASAAFLALYIVIDRDRMRGGLFALVPRTQHLRLSRIILNLETIVGGYIRGQVMTSLFMALFVLVLLTICRVPNAIALAAFAGAADVLPYVGVFLSVVPAVAVAFSVGPGTALTVLIAMVIYEEFESRFLIPRIYGRALRLPPSIVLVALLTGTTLMGIVGALLALPLAAAIRMLVEDLRVELPGEQAADTGLHARDVRAEKEYERRVDGVPAEQAAAIAAAMSEDRREEEGEPDSVALPAKPATRED